MNPAILGALIGAVPGTLAAALTVWSANRTSRATLEQTNLTLAADHKRWLLEKRADVYIDVLTFLRDAHRRRTLTLLPQKATDEIRHAIKEGYEIYKMPELQELVARAIAYTSDKANDSFNNAWYKDQAVWRLAWDGIEGGDLVIGTDLKRAIEIADKSFTDFNKIARNDLQGDFMR